MNQLDNTPEEIPMYRLNEAFIDDLSGFVLSHLNASNDECKRVWLMTTPSRFFILGTLADRSKDYTVGEDIGAERTSSKSSVRHNSQSVSFLVKKGQKGSISIKPECAAFVKVYPTFKEQSEYVLWVDGDEGMPDLKKDPGFAEYWLRKECEFPTFTSSIDRSEDIYELDFSSVEADILAHNNYYNKKGFERSWLDSEEKYNANLAELIGDMREISFEWKGALETSREKFDADHDIVSIRFENQTIESDKFETTLFNCRFVAKLNGVTLVPFSHTYEYEDIEYTENPSLRRLRRYVTLDYIKRDVMLDGSFLSCLLRT